MTDFKPVGQANGLEPHYKVRLVFGSALIHLASASPPKIRLRAGKITDVTADWIEDYRYGDTIGHIDWATLTTITWRWCE